MVRKEKSSYIDKKTNKGVYKYDYNFHVVTESGPKGTHNKAEKLSKEYKCPKPKYSGLACQKYDFEFASQGI
eukprot:snap_masked-scaffold_61-processed-gene-0.58-mRNA-1 protein AED:1.00 eAED:1.00 QI:0/0/0/0/1/1/3/0/71